MREADEIKSTTNNAVYRKILRSDISCPRCGFHRGCNRHRGSRHGHRKLNKRVR